MKKAYELETLKVKRRGILPALQAEESAKNKVRITIALDQDIIDYFKSEAANPGAFPYQTQINQALRKLIAKKDDGEFKELKSSLLSDNTFVQKLAKKISQSHTSK